MVSGIVGDSVALTYVQGHHVYHTVWTPVIGKVLPVKREETNLYDSGL